MKCYNKLSYRLKKLVRLHKRQRILQSIQHECDMFLVSFPKSGNSWVRFLFANYLNAKEESVDFINLHTFIPDSHLPKQLEILANKEFKKLPVRIVKSHDQYFSYFKNKKVIYVVREGKSALNSYYHYLNARRTVALTKEELLAAKHPEIQSWPKHLSSWKRKRQNILIVKYEDLRTNTISEFRKMLVFSGLKVDEYKLSLAVELSSFENMKKIELKGYFTKSRINQGKNTEFVRQGSTKLVDSVFSDEELIRFEKESVKTYELYDYKTSLL